MLYYTGDDRFVVKIIQDLWILKEGLVIFKRVYDEKLDSDLFAGLMTALKMMGDEIGLKKGLSNFEVDNKKYFIQRERDIIFIANGDARVKEKSIMKELDVVVKSFFEEYGSMLGKGWRGGDVSCFDKFSEKIDDSLRDPIQRFRSVYG